MNIITSVYHKLVNLKESIIYKYTKTKSKYKNKLKRYLCTKLNINVINLDYKLSPKDIKSIESSIGIKSFKYLPDKTSIEYVAYNEGKRYVMDYIKSNYARKESGNETS